MSCRDGTTPPQARYQDLLNSGSLGQDDNQRVVIDLFQDLYQRLLTPKPSAKRWFPRFGQRKDAAAQMRRRGLYLWGGIGRGKSLLMDVFFHSVPGERKRRVHFHDFMLDVQAELRKLRSQPDPLEIIALQLVREIDLLCFDELQVSDVADAMILGELLQELLSRGVYLVATSNVEPGNLYQGGLQRQRFLPAIRLIEQRLLVHRIPDGVDYRYRSLLDLQRYYSPLDNSSAQKMRQLFERLAPEASQPATLRFAGRDFLAIGMGSDVAWFSFQELCVRSRAAADYLFLAEHFHTLFLSDVPLLADQDEDLAQRLIILVDVLYERNINLILSAAALPSDLYRGERLWFPFQRTVSRLTEMQSEEYVGRQPHGRF